MATEGGANSYIRILKHPDSGFLADYHLPLSYGQLYGRRYRRLIRNVRGVLDTYLKEHPSSPKENKIKIEIKSEPTPVEEFYDKYCSLSKRELARIRKALAKKIPDIAFS